MEAKIPEDKLMKIGFRLLDIIYGELTIEKGKIWDEIFVDRDGDVRLGYDKPTEEFGTLLGYLNKDVKDFIRIIPVEMVSFERVLRDWFEGRYKRGVDIMDWYTVI